MLKRLKMLKTLASKQKDLLKKQKTLKMLALKLRD